MPEIAGLHAVLPRLLAHNSTVVTAAMKVKWGDLMERVPELPVGPCAGPAHNPHNTQGECLQPAEILPAHASNGENPDLYAVHPYRQVGLYTKRSLGIATFEARFARGNTGWSQDLMNMGLLGLANESAAAAIARANEPPYNGTTNGP